MKFCLLDTKFVIFATFLTYDCYSLFLEMNDMNNTCQITSFQIAFSLKIIRYEPDISYLDLKIMATCILLFFIIIINHT